MNTAEQSQFNLLVHVARLYYLQRLTHQEIANRLGLSRIKVTRLLQKAVDDGIVEFRIAEPLSQTFELEEELRSRFHLKKALVVSSGENAEQLLEHLGARAADYLGALLEPGSVIGIGWGRTLEAVCRAARKKKVVAPGSTVVSLTGGMAATTLQPNPYDVATHLARAIGGTPRYLLLPAIVESARMRALLLDEPSSRQVTDLWEKLTVCLLSIGSISPQTGLFYSHPQPARACDAVRKQGGVGDLLAQYFSADGTFLTTAFSDRTLAMDVTRLPGVALTIGVAGGAQKADAILGALRSGCLNVVVTDETAARRVLESP